MRTELDRAGDTERASSSAATIAAQTSVGQPAVLSFAAALQRHRQTAAPREKHAGAANDAARRETRSTRAASSSDADEKNRRAAARSTDASTCAFSEISALGLPPPGSPQMLALHFGAGAGAETGELHSQAAAAAAATAAHLQRTRRIRDAFGASALPCIEFSHSETGTRFRLSRDNGVWLLSIGSQLSSSEAEVHSLIEGLRSHFHASGLGALDVICID